MTEKPLRGEVLPRAKSAKVSPSASFDAFNAVKTMVEAGRELVVVYQTEKTKRARLETYERTELAKIRAAESVLQGYFREVFAERRENFRTLFDRLDNAIDDADASTVASVLSGIVDIAQSSPLRDLGDLGQIRKALDDPDQIWDL